MALHNDSLQSAKVNAPAQKWNGSLCDNYFFKDQTKYLWRYLHTPHVFLGSAQRHNRCLCAGLLVAIQLLLSFASVLLSEI